MAINKITIDKIASQAIEEISFARDYKQGKVSNWQKNEDAYYSKKRKLKEARANVNLGRMQEFVHTLLSKIDNPLVFKFVKRKNSQLKRVELLNSLRQRDQDEDMWDMKDIVGKKQAIIYGRAVYSYFADSINGRYVPHLEPIDVYDFLIDPSCGGIDIEEARYLGSYSVMLDRRQLKEGVKNKIYNKKAVDQLLAGSGNAGEETQEETNKKTREYAQSTLGHKENNDRTKFKFWRWFTTYQEDGLRYYLLMDNHGNCIRCEPLQEVFLPTEKYPLGAWPIWTWAAFPDLTEFWTPSYCDYAREIFMAQDVSINQMLDNAEAINKPQKVVNVSAIENLSQLKYRRDGFILTKGDYDANRAIQTLQTPSIRTPLDVFQILEGIQEKASGVTAGSAGVADERGKVGIYEGNQAATADRFGLLNKSYSHGYKRFGRLYEMGVRQHLVKKTAIDIIGPDGIEVKEVKRSDIFKKTDEFALSVEASNAQTLSSIQDKTAKINFLNSQTANPLINQKKAFEIKAGIAGLSEDEIGQLLDTSFYGNSELMSEADADIEGLLEGEDVPLNYLANNAYKQKLVNYMRDHQADMSKKQFAVMAMYVDQLEPIIMRNEARAVQAEANKALTEGGGALPKGDVVAEEGATELLEEPTQLSDSISPQV
jgi:hypothetical protein